MHGVREYCWGFAATCRKSPASYDTAKSRMADNGKIWNNIFWQIIDFFVIHLIV